MQPMLTMRHALIPLVVLTLCACSSDDDSAGATATHPEGGVDSGADVATADAGDSSPTEGGQPDAASDSAIDSAPDSTIDAQPDAPPPEPAIHYVGRHETTGNEVRFGWSGAGLVARFSGTGVQVRMNDPSGFFTVVVDGVVQPVLNTQPGEQTYDLASGLSDAPHVVEMYRRAEGFFGVSTVFDVIVQGTLLSPPPVQRRIEVIGDSITCGYGNLGADQYCDFSADTEDHYQTYAAIAARVVGAELSAVAWSGKGMLFNYGDDTQEPMSELYPRTIPTEAGDWSFGWQPDAVVINLGTNDFSTDGDPTETQFVSTYVTFLEKMRARYPNAMVMCTVAPLLGGDDEVRAVSYVQSAVSQRNAAGDDDVKWIDLRVDPTGYGCDWHPSVATHEQMAQLLVAELESALGW